MQQAHPSSGGSHVVFPSISEATSGLMKDETGIKDEEETSPLQGCRYLRATQSICC